MLIVINKNIMDKYFSIFFFIILSLTQNNRNSAIENNSPSENIIKNTTINSLNNELIKTPQDKNTFLFNIWQKIPKKLLLVQISLLIIHYSVIRYLTSDTNKIQEKEEFDIKNIPSMLLKKINPRIIHIFFSFLYCYTILFHFNFLSISKKTIEKTVVLFIALSTCSILETFYSFAKQNTEESTDNEVDIKINTFNNNYKDLKKNIEILNANINEKKESLEEAQIEYKSLQVENFTIQNLKNLQKKLEEKKNLEEENNKLRKEKEKHLEEINKLEEELKNKEEENLKKINKLEEKLKNTKKENLEKKEESKANIESTPRSNRGEIESTIPQIEKLNSLLIKDRDERIINSNKILPANQTKTHFTSKWRYGWRYGLPQMINEKKIDTSKKPFYPLFNGFIKNQTTPYSSSFQHAFSQINHISLNKIIGNNNKECI